MHQPHPNRRQFMQTTAAVSAGLAGFVTLRSAAVAESNDEKIVVAVMGLGRGKDLAHGFAALNGAHLKYICDVDQTRLDRAAADLAARGRTAPTLVTDFRRILDDPAVQAIAIATPDHWHGPATILACAAGKHVYVEKPISHNPREGELMVAAARKHRRVVQVGTQRRTWPKVVEALELVRRGDLGKVLFSRGWYNADRGTIGRGKATNGPSTLDFTLWQGPAPQREYRDNVVPYNWHWFWHWGTGELGNNGIHALDLCRWGLAVDYPRRVSAGGGRYHFDDDQETPDTMACTFDFGDKAIFWEGRSCHPRGVEGLGFGVEFQGEQGTLVSDGTGYKTYDPKGKLMKSVSGSGGDAGHLQNFLDCIRSGERPHADIEDGHKSTLLCHLGNIAWRTGRTVNLDPNTHQILNDAEAQKLWTREYQAGWEPKV